MYKFPGSIQICINAVSIYGDVPFDMHNLILCEVGHTAGECRDISLQSV